LALYPDAASAAGVACFYVSVFGAGAFAGGAYGLLLDCEFGFASVVEVAEGDCDAHFHVWAAALAALVAEVAAAAEEAGEEVEGVVLLAGAAALLVLLDAIVAVLVVYLAGLLLTEDFVGFGYFDELLTCSFVAAGSS
jgi:hypothetical protein